MPSIEKLQDVILRLHGCESIHTSTVPVTERFRGQVIWSGKVEIFNIRGHPNAHHCYAWSYHDEQGTDQYTAVLELPPVRDALTAVQAAIAAQVKNETKKT